MMESFQKPISEILEYLDLTRGEFDKIIDKFRPKHLWENKNGKWELKHTCSLEK